MLYSLGLCQLLAGLMVSYLANANSIQNEDEDHIITEVGADIILPCWPSDFPNKEPPVYWVRSGAKNAGESVQEDGSLSLTKLTIEDTSLYTCRREDNDHILRKAHLYVKGSPAAPTEVTSEGCQGCAIVTWHQHLNLHWEEEMGGAITSVHLRYRIAATQVWQYMADHLPPSQGKVEVYGLEPNTTYEFELWSQNRFGKSDYVSTFGRTAAYSRISLTELDPVHTYSVACTVLISLCLFNLVCLVGWYRIYARMRQKRPDRYLKAQDTIELVPNIVENPNYSELDTKLLTHPHQGSTFM